MSADSWHAEEILYSHTFMLWRGCSDAARRHLYYDVLELARKRMYRLGFTDERLREIENFSEMREGLTE